MKAACTRLGIVETERSELCELHVGDVGGDPGRRADGLEVRVRGRATQRMVLG